MNLQMRFPTIAVVILLAVMLVIPSANTAAQDATPTATAPSPSPSVRLVAGDFVFEIAHIWSTDTAGDQKAKELYLVLEGVLFNNSSEDVYFVSSDFSVGLAGRRFFLDLKILYLIQRAYLVNRSFPGYEIAGNDFRQHVPAKSGQQTFLVFEVPKDFNELDIYFNPQAGTEFAQVSLAVEKQANSDYSFWMKGSNPPGQNGTVTPLTPAAELKVTNITITNTSLQSVLAVDTVTLPNCAGSAPLTIRKTLSKQIERRTRVLDSERVAATIGISVAILEASVTGEVAKQTGTEEGKIIQETYQLEMSAAPGTRISYQVQWVQISKAGVVEVTQGDKVYYVEFSIPEALQANIQPPVSEKCD